MMKSELIKKLTDAQCGDVEVIVRGEYTLADIADVQIDHDHSDDSEFLAIDLENEPD